MLKPDFTFVHSAQWQKRLGPCECEDSYAPAQPLACRLNIRLSRDPGSEAPAAAVTAYFPAGTPLSPGDRVCFGGETYCVTAVQPRFDLSGAENHVEAALS